MSAMLMSAVCVLPSNFTGIGVTMLPTTKPVFVSTIWA
jgi:hypothetical protein